MKHSLSVGHIPTDGIGQSRCSCTSPQCHFDESSCLIWFWISTMPAWYLYANNYVSLQASKVAQCAKPPKIPKSLLNFAGHTAWNILNFKKLKRPKMNKSPKILKCTKRTRLTTTRQNFWPCIKRFCIKIAFQHYSIYILFVRIDFWFFSLNWNFQFGRPSTTVPL